MRAAGAIAFTTIDPPSGRGTLMVAPDVALPALPPRAIYVWQPDAAPPQQGFPVLYLQDGQNLFDARLVPFGIAWEADRCASRLIDAGIIPPVMLVGIASTAARFQDYAPALILDRLPAASRLLVEGLWGGSARSASYATAVIEHLKPMIDAQFPTSPVARDTIVGGASLGAAVALEILARYPDRVGGAACLSAHVSLLPVTGAEPIPADFQAAVVDAVADFANSCLPEAGRHRLWIDRSDEGIDRFYPPSHAALVSALRHKGFAEGDDLMARCYPAVGHDESAWRARLGDVLAFLFAARQPVS